jgi:hypothetical protein
LAADKGYALSNHVMVPFKSNSREFTKAKRATFNK